MMPTASTCTPDERHANLVNVFVEILSKNPMAQDVVMNAAMHAPALLPALDTWRSKGSN